MLIPTDEHTGQPLVTAAMKADCIGGFSFQRETTCSACYFDEPDEECEVCGGEVEYTETVIVPWASCKEIYKAMAIAASK